MSGTWARCGLAAVAGVAMAVAGLTVLAAGPAGAIPVSDEATFRTAWTNPAETRIDLAHDVTLTCRGGAAVRPGVAGVAIIVDGHGHSITQTCPNQNVLEQDGTGRLDFSNVKIVGGAAGTGGGNGVSVTANHSTTENGSTVVINGGSNFADGGVTSIDSNTQVNGDQTTSGHGIFIQSSGSNVSGAIVTITHSTNKPPRRSRGRRDRRDRADRRSDNAP